MSTSVMESSSLIHCFEYTGKLISQKTPFKLDIKLPNGFVFNMSWDDDRIPKACKDLKKSLHLRKIPHTRDKASLDRC